MGLAKFNQSLANQILLTRLCPWLWHLKSLPVDVFGFGISLIPPANSVDRFVSLFAPSVLILTIGQGRIGCKNETKTEEKGEMYGAGKDRAACIFIFM